MSNKVKITFPNGETIQCDKLIASLRNNDTVEGVEQLFIGDWSLNQLVETKFILNEIFNDQIKEQLDPAQRSLFEQILVKKKEREELFRQSLSDQEAELYRKISQEPEIVKMESQEELEEIELENLFGELLDAEAEKPSSTSEVTSEQEETDGAKVIDFESYKQQKL
ncbi:hypothetical protein [Halanaerobaculum tunisiense]